ncbi:MAG TPA: hypothetical protein VKQ72_13900 [Aggregatilineales bacterium]|nr:hypothetical protein [Aggregatilineales bacterium]
MQKPPFELNPEQIEALRQVQAQWQQTRGQSKMLDTSALQANRSGQITPEQRKELISRASGFGMVGLLLWFVVFGALVVATGRYFVNNPVIGFIALFGTLFVVLWVMGRITSIPMRLRLNHANIQEVSGEVVWHGARYVAEANGKLLQAVFSGGMTLPPGLYTFFCLEGTPYLLSAAMTGTHDGASASLTTAQNPSTANFDRAELSRALSQSNGFTAQDLEVNRAGRLSGSQIRSVLGDVTSNLWGVLVILIIVALALYGFSTKVKPDVNGLLLVLAFLGFGILIYMLQILRDLRDILGGRVIAVEGIATRGVHSAHGSHSGATYYYRLAGHNFTVSHAGYEALLEGIRYRVYYVPITGRLVSIEPLG